MKIFSKIGSILAAVFGFLFFIIWAILGIFSLGGQDALRKYYAAQPDILVLEVSCANSNRLALMEQRSYSGGGVGDRGRLIRLPFLSFNGKVVSRAASGRVYPEFLDPGLPINPSDRAKLIIKTFYTETAESDWTVYVNPKEFTPAEYEQITSCYEAHREAIEETLKNSQVSPDWAKNSIDRLSFGFDSRAQRVIHIIYGELPQPQVFSTNSIRSGTIDDGRWVASATEVMTIYPNGKFQIDNHGKSGSLSWGGTMAKGNVKISGNESILNFDILDPPMLESAKAMTDREYIESFINNENQKLTEFYKIGSTPPRLSS